MNYAFWANATAVTHFLIIAAVIVGLLASFRYKRFRPWEAGILVSVFIFWSYYGNCPLAILEQYLREQAGQDTNITSIGFTTYYAQKLLGWDVPSRIIQNITFFSGAMFFGASIEWLAPWMHMEVFKARRMFRRIFLKRKKRFA